MASVNKVILIGNLGGEPDVRMTTDGRSVAILNIATSYSYRNQAGERVDEPTEWHRVVFFGRTAETCQKYLHKGSSVYVEGRLKTRKWEKDGITRSTTEIMGESMTMLGGRQSSGRPEYPPVDDGRYSGFDNSSRPATSRPTSSQTTSYPQSGSVTASQQPRQSSPAAPGSIPGDNGFGLDEDIPF